MKKHTEMLRYLRASDTPRGEVFMEDAFCVIVQEYVKELGKIVIKNPSIAKQNSKCAYNDVRQIMSQELTGLVKDNKPTTKKIMIEKGLDNILYFRMKHFGRNANIFYGDYLR